MAENTDRSQEERAGFTPQPWPMFAGVLGDAGRGRVYLVAGWVGTVPQLLPHSVPVCDSFPLPPDALSRAGDVWVFGPTALGVEMALETERGRRRVRGH